MTDVSIPVKGDAENSDLVFAIAVAPETNRFVRMRCSIRVEAPIMYLDTGKRYLVNMSTPEKQVHVHTYRTGC